MKDSIVQLTTDFYNDYPQSQYPEILRKQDRPYSCIVIEVEKYILCVPFRTEMNHKIGYHFKTSIRSKNSRSGLDFSKIIVLKNQVYLKNAVVDKDEYNELNLNRNRIESKAIHYVRKYINHCVGTRKMNEITFKRQYGYSTLPYFHKELGIIKE